MSEPASLHTVCRLADLETSGARGFSIGEGEWPLRGFVVRDNAGILRAYVNRCPHAGHALDWKEHDFLTPDRDLIKCASHGALFARDTGICVAGPCAGRHLRSIAVSVSGDEVKIAAPAPEQ